MNHMIVLGPRGGAHQRIVQEISDTPAKSHSIASFNKKRRNLNCLIEHKNVSKE